MNQETSVLITICMFSIIFLTIQHTYIVVCTIIEQFWPLKMDWCCPNCKVIVTMKKKAIAGEKRILITCECNIFLQWLLTPTHRWQHAQLNIYFYR